MIAVALIVVFLISVFAFLTKDPGKRMSFHKNGANSTTTPTPTATNHKNTTSPATKDKSSTNGNANVEPTFPTQTTQPGVIESATTINSTVWMQVATIAWAYYQPGVGIDTNTGLPNADTGYNVLLIGI